MSFSESINLSDKKDYLVGVNYFSGWWRQRPNKYAVIGHRDWRCDFPERIALLGCYNDQETMDAEIVAASEYGIDYFLILFYVETPERHPHGKRLNAGLRQFLASPENNRMSFAIEFCNHPPFEILDDQIWHACCDEWVDAMKHPSYLRIGGKGFFKVHGLDLFITQNNNNIQKVAKRLDILREKAEKAGIGPLIIGAGSMAQQVPAKNMLNYLELFDFLATYMDVPDLPLSENDYPYEMLMDFAEKGWMNYASNSYLPYIPYVPAGWNPRPWGDIRPSFKFPDEIQWANCLYKVKEALDKYPKLRIPDGTSEGQKMLNIYAWNEFGEGGIVAPAVGDGWMKLEKIKEVFNR